MSQNKQNNPNMFGSVSELKDFLLWAKSEGVQSFQLGDVQVNFSPYVIAESAASKSVAEGKMPIAPNEGNEDEELLYWSSR